MKWWEEDDDDTFIGCRHEVDQNADWIGAEMGRYEVDTLPNVTTL